MTVRATWLAQPTSPSTLTEVGPRSFTTVAYRALK